MDSDVPGPYEKRHITCGIELELLLTPKPKLFQTFEEFKGSKEPDCKKVAQVLRFGLTAYDGWFEVLGRGEPKYDGLANSKSKAELYTHWTVTPDNTIEVDRDENGEDRAVEVVSRVLKPALPGASAKPWHEELSLVWKILHEYFEISTNESCGTHVHFLVFDEGSLPEDATYSINDLKALCKTIIYWDPAVQQSVPQARTTSRACRSNLFYDTNGNWPQVAKSYHGLKTKDYLREIFDEIDTKASPNPNDKNNIAAYMNQPSRFVCWNFQNLYKIQDKSGTVEFRLPPGVDTRAEAEHWIAYTLTFAGMSIHPKDCFSNQRLEGGPEFQFGGFKTYMAETHKIMRLGGVLEIDKYRVKKNHREGSTEAQKSEETY